MRPRPRDEKVRVNGGEGVFEVSLPAAARIAAMIDLDNWAARMQFHRELNRMGVIRALEEAGVASGDTVRIGKVEWEWD